MLNPLKHLVELSNNSRFTFPFNDNEVFLLVYQSGDYAAVCDLNGNCKLISVSNLVHPVNSIKNPASL